MAYLGTVFSGTSLAGGKDGDAASPYTQEEPEQQETPPTPPPPQDVITQPGVTRTIKLPDGRTMTITSSFQPTDSPTPGSKLPPSTPEATAPAPQPPAETGKEQAAGAAPAPTGMSTTTKVLIGVGVAAAVGVVGYLLWRSAKKSSAVAGIDLGEESEGDEDDFGSCPCKHGG